MSGEQIAGALTMSALGVALVAVGLLARRSRLELSLGGWTRDTASTTSWTAAHVVIGTWLVGAAGIAVVSAVAVALSPPAWTGPWVVIGCVGLLAVVVVGVARGTNRLEPASWSDL